MSVPVHGNAGEWAAPGIHFTAPHFRIRRTLPFINYFLKGRLKLAAAAAGELFAMLFLYLVLILQSSFWKLCCARERTRALSPLLSYSCTLIWPLLQSESRELRGSFPIYDDADAKAKSWLEACKLDVWKLAVNIVGANILAPLIEIRIQSINFIKSA